MIALIAAILLISGFDPARIPITPAGGLDDGSAELQSRRRYES